MSDSIKVLKKMKKANKLVQLTFREFGPRSYTRGQGALLAALAQTDGSDTQRNLTVALGLRRSALKAVVKKAKRNGFVTIEDSDEKRTYIVKLTEEGTALAAKRDKSNEAVADQIVECLSADELAQLDAICEKLIVASKERGISAKKKGHKAHKCRR